MGPPLIAAEDRARRPSRAPRRRLQWGRRSSRRKTSRQIAVRLRWLQWGRRSSRRKTPSPAARPAACFNGAAAHRGGRPGRRVARPLPLHRFNGAAAHRGGRLPTLDVSGNSALLQWGRRSSRRKTWRGRATSPPSATSFDGAAAHRGGRRRMARSRRRRRRLQWGRRSSRRKTGGPGSSRATGRASMGPPLIAAEDQERTDGRARLSGSFNGAAAHRGGRQGAQAEHTAGPLDRRFNGAAAHRGGRPSGMTTVPLVVPALQWGRRSSRRKTGRRRWPHDLRGRRFNGAAAHRGGRRPVHGAGQTCTDCFNGAAAHRGGRPTAQVPKDSAGSGTFSREPPSAPVNGRPPARVGSPRANGTSGISRSRRALRAGPGSGASPDRSQGGS